MRRILYRTAILAALITGMAHAQQANPRAMIPDAPAINAVAVQGAPPIYSNETGRLLGYLNPAASPAPTVVPTGLPSPVPTAPPTVVPTIPPTAQPTAAPTALPPVANCPAQPALVNQQNFRPGAIFGSYTVTGNGQTDDTNAMKAALSAGDVLVARGNTYLLGSTSYISVPTGRNIICQDRTAILKFIPTTTDHGDLFQLNGGNNNFYNCTFVGPYATMHNQVPAPGYDGCNGTCPSGGSTSKAAPWTAGAFILAWGQAANVTIVNNDFDGISGYNGAIELGTVAAGGTCAHDWRICGNSLESSGLEGVEISCGYNNTVNWNTFTSAGAGEEAWPNSQAQLNTQLQHNTWDHNVFHWIFGTGQNNNNYCGIEGNRLVADMLHVCSGCTTAGATSFSTNVVSNNTFDTPNGSVGTVPGCTNVPCGLKCGILSQATLGRATFSNNKVTGICGTCNQ